jgi:hypothetical protein
LAAAMPSQRVRRNFLSVLGAAGAASLIPDGARAAFVAARLPYSWRWPAWRVRQILEDAEGVLEGREGSLASVFIDLQCPACRSLFWQTRGAVQAGAARLHWIPVATLGPVSLRLAEILLAALDRADALEGVFHPLTFRWDKVPAERPHRDTTAVMANTRLLRALRGPSASTPTVLTRGPDGNYEVWPAQ